VDSNTLTFVGIHELNMEVLLEVAVKHKLYRPENYESQPKQYCGIEITSSPLKDDFLK